MALDGIDAIVFAGGIGENDAAIHCAICDGLSWAKVNLDKTRNTTASNLISDASSRCSVRVVVSQEDEQIARHSRALL
jgi:acetate kinase